MKKNKELQEAESVISHQNEQINMLNIQQKDEVDALQKKLQSNKCALDALKKTLDNEKAFRICADEEIKNLKEQLKCNTTKYKCLENENEKLINEKLKIEEVNSKISQQCNELIQKNISLENYCEKKELAFDEQVNSITQLENSITKLKEKTNNLGEVEGENNKLIKQVKSFSKQMEAYENEREVYVQRLQKIQKEENELKYIIRDLKKEVEVQNSKINYLNEKNSDISSNNAMLSSNINNLQVNFTNSLKLLDEIFDNYVKIQVKQNKSNVINELPLKLEPFLNETFELFEHTLTEYKLLKTSFKESEITLKDEINKKENIIQTLKDTIENNKKEIIKKKIIHSNLSETKTFTEDLNCIQIQDHTIMNNKFNLNDELEKNLTYINQIKVEILPKQKLLISGCKEFMLNKIVEIESLNMSKNDFTRNVQLAIGNLKKEITDKNITINGLKRELLILKEKVTEKDVLYNEMEHELQHLRDNFGAY